MTAPVNPARRDIRLRPGPDGTIERQLRDGTWHPTGLSRDFEIDDVDNKTLDGLLEQLLATDKVEDLAWDLRLAKQNEIGRKLYRALFSREELGDPGRWLHLVPDASSAASPADRTKFLDLFTRIPWAFLTRADSNNAPFLMLDPNESVSITIDAAPDRGYKERFEEISFPLRPRVLLVIPRVKDEAHPTYAEAHQRELEAALNLNSEVASETIQFARTFKEFRDKLRTLHPDVIYFYGHGLSDGHRTEFQFEQGDGLEHWIGFDEISNEIQALMLSAPFPPVVWVNACLGAAANQESALRMLAPLSCCVIATRSVIATDDSRTLARNALPLIVDQGRAPNSAIRQAMHESPLTIRSARWATTIVAIQFGIWSTAAPEQRPGFDDLDLDSIGDFPRVLDRQEPLFKITSFLRGRIGNSKAKPTALLWHGDLDQGLDVFEARIGEHVRDMFPDRPVRSRYVDLQADLAPSRSDALVEHFLESVFYGLKEMRKPLNEKALVDPGRIKLYIDSIFTGRSLGVILHAPLLAAQVPLIKKYLAFWEDYFPDLAPDRDILLGFGFVGADAPDLPVDSIHALGPVPPRELELHMWNFRSFYRLPPNRGRISELAHSYVDECDGRFEPIRLKLEQKAGFNSAGNPGGKGEPR